MKIAIIGTGGIGTGGIGAGLASVPAKTACEITVADRKGGTEAAAKLAGRGLKVAAAEVRAAVQNFVAADDAEAQAAVIGLAKDAGLDARDAGPLSNARYIEPLAYLNIQFGHMLGQGTQIAPVWLSR